MLLDWALVGGTVFGLALAMNATVFRTRPSPWWLAWSLSLLVFAGCFVGLFLLKVIRYKQLSAEIGVSLNPGNPFDGLVIAGLFAWVFGATLRRRIVTSDRTSLASQSAPHDVPVLTNVVDVRPPRRLPQQSASGWSRLGIVVTGGWAGWCGWVWWAECSGVVFVAPSICDPSEFLFTLIAPIVLLWSVGLVAKWVVDGFRR